MKAEERKDLQKNDLAEGATSLLGTLRTGNLAAPWAYRAVGLTFAAVVIIGLIWYLRSESRNQASHEWTQFATATGSDLETVVTSYPDTLAGKAARLQMARTLLGEQGIGKLTAMDREAQNKAISNIEKARDDLRTIAADLATHKTLRAAALADAATAELALVGVPKTADAKDGTRGTVKMAADYYTQAATVIGPDTPAGVELTKKAADLTAHDEMLTKAAFDIYSRTMPLPSFDGSRPGGIQTPPTIAPKTDLPPADPIKAPDAPVTSPSTKK